MVPTVNLPAPGVPQSYKQDETPPLGHSVSPASSFLPQEAGPTSISRNLGQGTRTYRWSISTDAGRGRHTSPRRSGGRLVPLRPRAEDGAGEKPIKPTPHLSQTSYQGRWGERSKPDKRTEPISSSVKSRVQATIIRGDAVVSPV